MNNDISTVKERHTYKMGVIGNCSYLAYVGIDSNIKWMCMPRFDSSFIFGSLIDEKKGGEFSVKPADTYTSKQYYLPNSNILVTEFHAADGAYKVIDFAPRFLQFGRYFKPLMLVRKIELISGSPKIVVSCKPVGDYGNTTPEVVVGSNHIRYLNLDSHVRLSTDVPLNYVMASEAFVLTKDRYLLFSYGVPLEASLETTCEDFYFKTLDYWQLWIKSSYIPNIFQSEIIRSALVLKLHQYEDTGGIIASGSMALPESHNSGRTWDYRYCWMRDTYYTLNAFNHIGHFEESEKYFEYIQNIIIQEKERVQPLYSVTGKKDIDEIELDLAGYLGNKPVRLGNQAYTHIQNDVYGQVLLSLVPLFTDQRLVVKIKHKNPELVKWLLDRIEMTMHEPDAGLWEFRNKQQFHTYTYLFHWAGSKAALKIGKAIGDTKLMEKATKLILENEKKIELCYSSGEQAYMQAIGSPNFDASTIKLISMNYLEHNSDKAKMFVKKIEEKLHAGKGLFFRYKHEDDFGKPETTFLVCAFWYIEALACVGRVDEALKYLENMTTFANHLGIFSEDVSMETGDQWGNYPQTYSHVGLINAAFRIANKLDKQLFE